MTRAQRLREADALLNFARIWQNGMLVSDCLGCLPASALELMNCTPDGSFEWAVSAALSEAARLADDELVNEEE